MEPGRWMATVCKSDYRRINILDTRRFEKLCVYEISFDPSSLATDKKRINDIREIDSTKLITKYSIQLFLHEYYIFLKK